MDRKNIRRLLLWSIPLVFSFILLMLAWVDWGVVTRGRDTLRRIDADTIRWSWDTGSGHLIGPMSTMHMFAMLYLPRGTGDEPMLDEFPTLAPYNGVWMYVVDPDEMPPVDYVNPKLEDAENRIFDMLELRQGGGASKEIATQLAAQSYTYLGWVVMNEKDVAALKEALANRSEVDLGNDLITSYGTLYRLRRGVERRFASDPNDEDAVQSVRRTIPVMFESMNVKAGHPGDEMHVLYLDGHVEGIPYGERFPALRIFVDAFPPPELGQSMVTRYHQVEKDP